MRVTAGEPTAHTIRPKGLGLLSNRELEVEIPLDPPPDDDWTAAFERRLREQPMDLRLRTAGRTARLLLRVDRGERERDIAAVLALIDAANDDVDRPN